MSVRCAGCGLTSGAATAFCAACGRPLAGSSTLTATGYAGPPVSGGPENALGGRQTRFTAPIEPWMIGKPRSTAKPRRPPGVAVLAGVELITGALFVVFGSMFMGYGNAAEQFFAPEAGAVFVPSYGAALGGLLFFLGVVYMLLAWGTFTGRGWAWTVALILQTLWAFYNAVTITITFGFTFPFLLINAVTIWYLLRPPVKRFFGQAVDPAMQVPLSEATRLLR